MTPRELTATGYAALAALLVVLEVVGLVRPQAVPSVSVVLRRVCRTRAGQLTVLLAWWWLGWHFLLAQ